MPETEEGYQDDGMSICRICRSSEQKMHIDWAQRWKLLEELLQEYQQKSGENYDCLVPISGGKDSMFQLHVLCKILKIKPLTVTFNQNWLSETGYYNLTNTIETFNVDHIQFTPNRSLVNRLARKSLGMIGDACWHCHSGVGAFPISIAMKFGIPLIVYGESVAEVTQRGEYAKLSECYGKDYYTKYSAKKTPDEMVDDTISPQDIHMFQLPSDQEFEREKIRIIHLGDYIFWDDERQMEFLREEYGWRETEMENAYKGYKSAECIMPGVHDFSCYQKRGWGRASFHASVDVRAGILDRQEGLELARKHDTQRPEALDYYLKITGYTEEEFYQILAEHREPQLQGKEIPVTPKDHANGERILPFPLQVLEKLCPNEAGPGAKAHLKGRFAEFNPEKLDVGELATCSVAQLITGFERGDISPLDLAESVIRTIETRGPQAHAFACHVPERLREAARASEVYLKQGSPARLLEGIPVGIKDIFNTMDYPTQMGSPLWADFEPGNDARSVFNLRREGALVAGKTVTAEFAVHALNQTLNPHDSSRTPGTSSSGSAAAVAAGMVPVAIGSQTAASITRPASYCGIYGMKPSYGVIPRTGVLKTTDTLDTIGFFTRHLEDMERVFNALRLHGSNYPMIHQRLENPSLQKVGTGGKWKVALVRTHLWDQATEHVRDSILSWMDRATHAGIGVEFVEADLPSEMEECHAIHETIYNRCLAYYFQEEFKSPEDISPIMAKLLAKGQAVTVREYQAALEAQTQIKTVMEEFMSRFDALVTVCTNDCAPGRDDPESDDPGLMWTLAHLPVVSVPAFLSPDGLPVGLQLVGGRYRDYGLLDLLRQMQIAGLIPSSSNPAQ